MKTVSEESASAAELETPHSLDEAMETGFLPDDPHYRLTGEFKSEKTDASAAASKKEDKSENEEASATSSAADTAAASAAAQAAEEEEKEAGKDKGRAQSKTAHTSENRWQKRERELKELREENTRLKSQSSRPEPRSDSKQPSQTATETTAAAKAAPKPKIDDVDAKTGKAKFANYTEYEDAKDAWLQESAVRQFQETQSKTQQLTEHQQREREIGQNLQKKFEPVRAKYADFDKVALGEHVVIPKGSVTELFILDSDHAGEVAYYLGQHPEITNSFYANHDPKTGKFQSLITPQRQFRKLMEIEASLSGAGSGAGASDEKTSSSSSAKPVTQASRPPHQVSGKGTVAKDAVEQAVEDGDTETYIRAQNAKELARFKRK